MKYAKKIIVLLLIFLILLIVTSPNVFADDGIDTGSLSQIGNPSNLGSFSKITGRIVGVIYVFAAFMSVATLIVIGIRYVTSSPDQKASVKARAIPYVIGAVLVFGAANILRFIQKMSTWIQS